MLEEVRITGLGVIDDAVLELSSGFTVLTGETGAGKTMVVTALGLLFGGRADPARVRPGAERATVEGRLFVSAEVAREVEDAGGDLDDNGSSLVLSRSIAQLHERHIQFVVTSLMTPVRQQLEHYGISGAAGPDDYFDTPGQALEAFNAQRGGAPA